MMHPPHQPCQQDRERVDREKMQDVIEERNPAVRDDDLRKSPVRAPSNAASSSRPGPSVIAR